MFAKPHIEPLGCEALIIRFGEHLDPELTPRIRALSDKIAAMQINGVLDQVPAYTTLAVHFDLRHLSYHDLQQRIKPLLTSIAENHSPDSQQIVIPVWYHPDVGPDLARIADFHQISVDEVIQYHSQQTYRVYAIGFAPGFAYLGEVSEEIATPRLQTPRADVPAGSVAIADNQTAVYPLSTPGGWNIVGRTAIQLFDRQKADLCPLKTGDQVTFQPVSRAAFVEAGGQLDE